MTKKPKDDEPGIEFYYTLAEPEAIKQIGPRIEDIRKELFNETGFKDTLPLCTCTTYLHPEAHLFQKYMK